MLLHLPTQSPSIFIFSCRSWEAEVQLLMFRCTGLNVREQSDTLLEEKKKHNKTINQHKSNMPLPGTFLGGISEKNIQKLQTAQQWLGET